MMSRIAIVFTAFLFSAVLDTMVAADGIRCLGMTLVDPGDELVKHYDLPKEHLGPIITEVHDPTFFPARMAPSEGCAFWIVESPANGFLFTRKKGPSYQPKTVREFAEAILACSVPPEEYEKVMRETAEAARKRADALKDQPAQRERLLQIANAKVPAEEQGKHVCRVVYHYPNQHGTMTTSIRMTKADLDHIRELLKK